MNHLRLCNGTLNAVQIQKFEQVTAFIFLFSLHLWELILLIFRVASVEGHFSVAILQPGFE